MTSDERKARIHERTMRDPIWRSEAHHWARLDGTCWANCPACASDGTDDDVDQGCCTDRCTGACGGYGFAFELAARNVRDGIEGARPIGTWIDETHAFTSDGTDLPPSVTAYECCGGSSPCREKDIVRSDGTEDEPLDIVLPSFVGMFRGGKADLARRAKDIVRGRPVEDTP